MPSSARGQPRQIVHDRVAATVSVGPLPTVGENGVAVAQIFGVNFSGFFAWWLWRTIYLSKLPRFEKKCRVALDWSLDLLFSKDLVQFTTERESVLKPRRKMEISA